MAGTGFTLVHNDISPQITRLIQSVSPPQRRRILRAMGTTFLSITQGNFNQTSSAYRPVPWPNKKDGTVATLKKTGLLSHSFHLTVDDNFARVANPVIYAATHQFGRDKIPARPFFPVWEGKLTPAAEKLILNAAFRVIVQ